MIERPASIRRFEMLYFASFVLTMLTLPLNFDFWAPDGVKDYVGALSLQLVVWLFIFILVLQVSRRASVIAKWVMVVLFGVWALSMIVAAPSIFQIGLVLGLHMIAQVLLQLYAMALLFKSESSEWFLAVKQSRREPAQTSESF